MNAPQRIAARSYLDALYADKPRPAELFTWPVHRDFLCSTKPVRWFDTWSEASTFAMANGLFLGNPKRRSA